MLDWTIQLPLFLISLVANLLSAFAGGGAGLPIAGSLAGGHLGAHLSIAKGNRWIKRVFEGLTLLVGIKLLLP